MNFDVCPTCGGSKPNGKGLLCIGAGSGDRERSEERPEDLIPIKELPASCDVEVGLLRIRLMRRILEKLKCEGAPISWEERSIGSFFIKLFTINGPLGILCALKKDTAFMQEN